MKKKLAIITIAALGSLMVGCGPSAEEQEKLKTEVTAIESNTTAIDSTMGAVKQTSAELDEIINKLNAQ